LEPPQELDLDLVLFIFVSRVVFGIRSFALRTTVT
jgi:hypothetical protein